MLRAPGNGSCVQASLNASTLNKGHMFVDKPKAIWVNWQKVSRYKTDTSDFAVPKEKSTLSQIL